MKIYKSKVDWWLVVLIVGVFGYPIVDGVLMQEYLLSIVFALVLILFYFLSKTVKYKINENNLIIWKTEIDIKSIKKIYKTRNPLSSPALSLDRIAIIYNKYDEVLISPKERKQFVEDLLKVNPDIIVEI